MLPATDKLCARQPVSRAVVPLCFALISSRSLAFYTLDFVTPSDSPLLLSLDQYFCCSQRYLKDEQCPSVQVEEWKFPQPTRQNITGFNLVRRFSLLKNKDVKRIRTLEDPPSCAWEDCTPPTY
ncbi:hypothetical protein KUCAC02_011605 [Chaenocephalus aceratus]|uniref:Uncharacterized protein n=1 Tax=Chaenocephalus aceratus TaxID=36190 RepID=A0ACB9WXT8_CHAAC|nr:hypothetical protein KUCAC02_011605 [Chaenocephalus aceratus]